MPNVTTIIFKSYTKKNNLGTINVLSPLNVLVMIKPVVHSEESINLSV